jgi:hypothetical protein
VSAPTHHLAMRRSLAVPLCGRDDGGGLSLDADNVTCAECRRTAGLGPEPEPDAPEEGEYP